MKRLQPELFEDYVPVEAGNALFCHEEFLEKLAEHRDGRIGKRVAYLLQRMVVDESRLPFKATLGVNRGWRRSRLGGNGGSHFYAWWAPKGAPPLKHGGDFESAPAGSIFMRAIRHHDDHEELRAQEAYNYVALTVKDLRRHDYTPSPLTAGQARFATARQNVRVLRGFPGSGKTTALWEAAEAECRSSALYITYSKELAALARAYFRRLSPPHKQFRVITFAQLIRTIAGVNRPEEPERDRRRRFTQHIGGFSPRVLGPWSDDRAALYDEIHAHLIGGALPAEAGRFARCQRPRVPDRVYREQRRQAIGGAAADAAMESLSSLERREGAGFLERFFPELLLAWETGSMLCAGGAGALARAGLSGFDCIAVDEVQDLAPLEAFVVAKIGSLLRAEWRRDFALLAAGDEGQTVRPTDFEWGWFNDILYSLVAGPSDFALTANLRSPRRIAEVVNRVSELYSQLAKQDRPGGTASAEVEDDAGDIVSYCAAVPGPELNELLHALVDREGMAVICLADEVPKYVPEQIRHKVLTVFEAKGLDFKSVCVLDAGRHLDRILSGSSERVRRATPVVPLNRRLAIDELRVALSRASERLLLIDVQPNAIQRDLALTLLEDREGASLDPVIPEVILKSLSEEALLPEERVRLCAQDAIRYLGSKPEMAWSRARQAISLLGVPGHPNAVEDESIADAAFLAAARVDFTLAVRGIKLPDHLGKPNLWDDAVSAAECANRVPLARVIAASGAAIRAAPGTERLNAILDVLMAFQNAAGQIEPWVQVELAGPVREWIADLEQATEEVDWAGIAVRALARAYEVFEIPNAAKRLAPLRQKAIAKLLDAEQFGAALVVLEQEGTAEPKLRARCYEGLGRHPEAAAIFAELGQVKEALRNYRSIPDLDAALKLAAGMGELPAREGLQWMAELRDTLARRPENFARVATEAEKRWVGDLLEANLGRPRRTPAKKRAPAQRKPGRPKKADAARAGN